ncbi:hypothetical protein CC86DRAFT_471661 [Ophiobolus disseminans]|uniref:Uncharacterized protein n=1 Tax=Ophiobolus disseminans TaxID=1469910 RepID=A0A6A6ZH43_9PLEO|nr:hypothetical protein CC86DRAFT_471661 [Ophiobolus disseminans]
MVGPGINLATTKDGEMYNKLQRPSQTYLASTAPPLPPTKPLAASLSPSTTTKRKRECLDTSLGHKRSRLEERKAGMDVNRILRGKDCGMQTTLPSLDDEEHSSDDSTCEAMAYLRSVRSQASAIPHLLVGNIPHSDTHDAGRERNVLFQDGTWIAVDGHGMSSRDDFSSEDETDTPDPQDRYYQLLVRRFHSLRTSFEATKEKKDVKIAKTISAVGNEPFLPRTERAWTKTIHQTSPKLEQVLHLDESAIYNGLQCSARSLDSAMSISAIHSCWIWSLLASVGDVGTMTHEKTGRIRDIGQKIGLMGVRLRKTSIRSETPDAEVSTRQSEGEEEDTDTNCSDAEMSISEDEDTVQASVEPSELDRARERLLTQLGDRLVHSRLPPSGRQSKARQGNAAQCATENDNVSTAVVSEPVPAASNSIPVQVEGKIQGIEDEQALSYGSKAQCASELKLPTNEIDLNTRVTIDMVLTIVAEEFGQRDLLTYRQRW